MQENISMVFQKEVKEVGTEKDRRKTCQILERAAICLMRGSSERLVKNHTHQGKKVLKVQDFDVLLKWYQVTTKEGTTKEKK